MKFHHLTRHQQFVANQQQQQQQAASDGGNKSPIMRTHHLNPHLNAHLSSLTSQQQHQLTKHLHQASQQQQQKQFHLQRQTPAAAAVAAANLTGSFSDDEDEFLNDYSMSTGGQQQSGGSAAAAAAAAAALTMQQQQQQLDTSGFLMDKNKKLFPQKLWELIHNPSIQHCLRWSQDGQRVYLNRNEFEAYYLKTPNNQFHTQKAISFVRQMNMYGFRKVDDCYYENDNFRRDQQHLLRNMIRRHPNKGLFVGLDHHQLAAAAAAQQAALQVNQQFGVHHQFDLSSQQKHHHHQQQQHQRAAAEQALRLNSYLSQHHQFHPSLLSHAVSQQLSKQQHQHSQFEQMSSQLAQAVAASNHLSQQQQQQQQQQHILQNSLSHQNPFAAKTSGALVSQQDAAKTPEVGSDFSQVRSAKSEQQSTRKSRLLSDFYAAANSALNKSGNLESTATAPPPPPPPVDQDSMHSSSSSVDTQPSRCSSELQSESAGSPRPKSPSAHLNLGALKQPSSASIRAGLLATGKLSRKFNSAVASGNATGDLQATDLSNSQQQSLAARQALHQTLVRSLLQLKQHNQQPQDFLATLQQQHQNSRSLLESLASLSSGGTGSIVDPASNSPTERTATPPSRSPSPTHGYVVGLGDGNNMALDLAAKTSSVSLKAAESCADDNEDDDDDDDDYQLDVDRQSDKVAVDSQQVDVARKVRRFLDNQMALHHQHGDHHHHDDLLRMGLKRERTSSPCVRSESGYPLKKRPRFEDRVEELHAEDIESMTKSLILELSDRRGDHLTADAISEAASYAKCFLETLLDDASSIAKHELGDTDEAEVENESAREEATPDGKAAATTTAVDESELADSANGSASETSGSKSSQRHRSTGVIDSESLSLALKLMPAKLLGAIQGQQQQQLLQQPQIDIKQEA